MANDTNWEAQLDWTKIDPVGGLGFYNFIKGSAIKSMEEGLKQLVEYKEDKERKLRGWDEIAAVAQRLDDDSQRIVGTDTFKSTIRRIDQKAFLLYADGTKMAIERWIEFGVLFAKTLRIAKKVIERVGERFWMEAEPLPKMV